LIFTHPGSRIQKQQQKRGVKKISCHTCLCSHKFHKIETYFSFEVLKKKRLGQKIVTKLSKIWVWDPGVKKASDPGSGSVTLHASSQSERFAISQAGIHHQEGAAGCSANQKRIAYPSRQSQAHSTRR
jgi:hypothetical protein